jgi:acyl CoA:acetate/3-ketoacid CoA transferase alpha subunit
MNNQSNSYFKNRRCKMNKKYYSFSEALEALKKGKRICREGWNGKGMYLFLSPKEWIDAIEKVKWTDYTVQPFICMKTAQNTIQPGWLASQADMLAEDWIVLD